MRDSIAYRLIDVVNRWQSSSRWALLCVILNCFYSIKLINNMMKRRKKIEIEYEISGGGGDDVIKATVMPHTLLYTLNICTVFDYAIISVRFTVQIIHYSIRYPRTQTRDLMRFLWVSITVLIQYIFLLNWYYYIIIVCFWPDCKRASEREN